MSIRPLPPRLRRYVFGAVGVVAALFAGALAFLPEAESSVFGEVPEQQRAYFDWIASLAEDDEAAVDAGFALAERYPDLHDLYLRLADLCTEQEKQAECAASLGAFTPADERTELYRQAALIVVDGASGDPARWDSLAHSPHLDVPLARRVVEAAAPRRRGTWFPTIAADWQAQIDADSLAHAGATFGLGYAAALRQEWDSAEPLLLRARRITPDEPDVYRELGRIYFSTGQSEAFESIVREGIAVATRTLDPERELILRGNLALSLIQRHGDLAEAETQLEEALAKARALGDGESEGFNLYRLAQLRFLQYRYAETLALVDSAAVRYEAYVPSRLAEVVALRGAVLRSMVRLEESDVEFSHALELAEAESNYSAQLQVLLGRSQLRFRRGHYTEAREDALTLLDLATRARQADAEMMARFVLGMVERSVGNYSDAREHFEAGVEKAEAVGSVVRLRNLYRELGTLALHTYALEDAESYFEKALFINASGEGELSRAYRGLGQAYKQYGNTEKALEFHEIALGYAQNPTHVHSARLSLGWTLIEDGDLASAREHFESVQEAKPLPSREFRALTGLAKISILEEDYRQALTYLSEAEEIEQLLTWLGHSWYLLHLEAVAHWKLGETDAANSAFDQALGLVEALRYNLDEHGERSTFIQDKIGLYEDYADFLQNQGRSAEAFHVTERARSRGLLDLLYASQRQRGSSAAGRGDPALQSVALWQRQQVLTEELSSLREQDDELGEAEQTRASFLMGELARADSLYQQSSRILPARDRAYSYDPIVPDSVRGMLETGEVLVLYDLRDGQESASRQSVVYLVTPDGVTTIPLEVPSEVLPDRIRFLRGQIGLDGKPGENWEAASKQLYSDLIAPILDVLPEGTAHLHLVPEGILHYVPFAALLDAEGQFLVERFTLSVAPSATVLQLSRARNPRQWRSMLLVADPTGRLPGARREANAIASASTSRRHVLTGNEAKEPFVTDVASSYDVLHFATHGNFFNQAPWRSHLELYDDVLTVAEIGQLELDAYLVTLSACQTALGSGAFSDVPPGDEWIGLHQAFLAAGTPSVLATLWIIDDKASSSFMIDFYERLATRSKAEALAQTQRKFIASEATRHPVYWAPFVLVGDPL